MARFIKIGDTVVNQDAITSVDYDADTESVHVNLVTGFGETFSGYHAAAFRNWLNRHVRGWGADVLEDYASDLADEARLMEEQRQQDEGI